MHIPTSSSLLSLLTLSLALASAIPTPWSTALLEEIEGLRARGLSESEIKAIHPRRLTLPSSAPLTHTSNYPLILSLGWETETPPSRLQRILSSIGSTISVGGGGGEKNHEGGEESWSGGRGGREARRREGWVSRPR